MAAMTDQIRRTWVLLDTLLDYLPGPQMIRSQADSLPSIDGSRPAVYSPAERDRQIAHIEHMARMRADDHSVGEEPWEAARREQYRCGDYAALDLAMAELEVVDELWASLAWRVAHHHPGVLDQALRVGLVRSISWLAERLPNPIKLPAWTTKSAVPPLATMLALRDMGVPYAVLARVYGKDAATLRKRVKKVSA